MVTGPWRDHTAKITVAGLKPGTRYLYRFVAPDGSVLADRADQDAARDRRARLHAPRSFRCSNMGFGYFNAYAHAARATISTWRSTSATISTNMRRRLSGAEGAGRRARARSR